MTCDDLTELERLANAATPGPWEEDFHSCNLRGDGHRSVRSKDGDVLFGANYWANLTFIAAAHPQAVLALLDRIAGYEAALEFYANEANWGDGDNSPATEHDEGWRARAALDKWKGKS